jgi:hypothetical protein
MNKQLLFIELFSGIDHVTNHPTSIPIVGLDPVYCIRHFFHGREHQRRGFDQPGRRSAFPDRLLRVPGTAAGAIFAGNRG